MSAENHAPDAELEQWDETSTSLGLRALFTVLAGSFLLWAQWHAPIADIGAHWAQWVQLSIVANLLLPLCIVWFFFAQSIVRVAYLHNQAMNAWNYGFDFGDYKTHFKYALAMTIVMLPVLLVASRDPQTRLAYAGYTANLQHGPAAALSFFALLVIYMFCWEWFHRGFLLFGIAQGAGPVVAVIVQAAIFGIAHLGKPAPEMAAAFAGGAVLGIIAWRQKSFAAAFYTHALVHSVWMLLLLI